MKRYISNVYGGASSWFARLGRAQKGHTPPRSAEAAFLEDVVATTLAGIELPAVLLDGDGQVLYANPSMDDAHDIAIPGPMGAQLFLDQLSEIDRLRSVAQQAALHDTHGHVILTPHNGQRTAISVIPLSEIVCVKEHNVPDFRGCIAVLHRVKPNLAGVCAMIERDFGLTQRETLVCQYMAAGCSRRETAQILDTNETVVQLDYQAVLDKTETASLSDLQAFIADRVD